MEIDALRAELAAQIERFTGKDGLHASAIQGLYFGRASKSQVPAHQIVHPAFCLMVQGSRHMLLNGEAYVYDVNHYLVVSQNLPICAHHKDASEEHPMLGLRIDFETRDLAAALLQMAPLRKPPPGQKSQRGMFTGEVSPDLLEAVLRLVKLLHAPADIPALAPLYLREILYRLLTLPEGWRLAQMASDSHGVRIARAIAWLQEHFSEPLAVEALAREVHMSVSSLHEHFKAVTAMSPLQFQKQLRLQEARRIMLAEKLDAGLAGHRVGYESQSQFSREYSRFFGTPPARDIKRLREGPLGAQVS